MCGPHALGLVPSRVFLLYRGDNRNRATLLKTAPSWVSAKALANHRPTDFGLFYAFEIFDHTPEENGQNNNSPVTFLKNHTNCPEGVLHFWLGWGTEGMSGHYDQIKNDVAFRKEDVVTAVEWASMFRFIGFN